MATDHNDSLDPVIRRKKSVPDNSENTDPDPTIRKPHIGSDLNAKIQIRKFGF